MRMEVPGAFVSGVGLAIGGGQHRAKPCICQGTSDSARRGVVSNMSLAVVMQRQDIGKSRPSIKGPRGPEFGGQQQKDTGGGVATKVREPEVKKKRKLSRDEDTDKEKEWRVLLHNDNVHTFDYVTYTITTVVKTISRKKAFRITMQAHSSGVSTVTTTWKALAEDYCRGLQMHGLTSSIAPDSHFHKC